MTGRVAELKALSETTPLAKNIADLYTTWNTQRKGWIEENKEVRDYLFATSTKTTTNSTLPWKNSTTLPKLTQIRDNLHANYLSALFPNDFWLRWEAHDQDSNHKTKRRAIESYAANKARMSGLRNTVSKLVYDYIDTGNAFVDVEWVNESMVDDDTGEETVMYIGPKLIRISPYDIVFNPTAVDFAHTPKITRYVKSIGELEWDLRNKPELKYSEEAIKKAKAVRGSFKTARVEDADKAQGFFNDGLGDIQAYFESGMVEILELEGDLYDPETGEFLQNHIITVMDRQHILRKERNPSWLGNGYKFHVGWRTRPDNLYAMSPLANIVGLQYRMDHLENLKADLMDLTAFPPMLVKGQVENFKWGPLEKILMDEQADVSLLNIQSAGLNAEMDINRLESRMEEFAGAPREAMGIRTAGEKTAFEVQSLQNAAGRIFQEKTSNFEINILEPAMNAFVELARRNLNSTDIIRVADDDQGVVEFLSITKEDLTAVGKLRPIGARHFAAQAQLVQNLTQLSNTSMWAETKAHRSPLALAMMLEDVMGLSRYSLFKENAGVFEEQDTQRMVQQATEDLAVEGQQMPNTM
jgi:hypothetical protein